MFSAALITLVSVVLIAAVAYVLCCVAYEFTMFSHADSNDRTGILTISALSLTGVTALFAWQHWASWLTVLVVFLGLTGGCFAWLKKPHRS